MIRALVEVDAPDEIHQELGDLCAIVSFEDLPMVGQCLEMTLDLLGAYPQRKLPGVWESAGVFGASLTIRHIYWQPLKEPGKEKVMIPVLVTEMSVPGKDLVDGS